MAKRKSWAQDHCPVARSVEAIGDRWCLLIVREAFDGVRRFSVFQKNLGVARNILSDRLNTLVTLGILALLPAADGSAYQEYALTEKGMALFPILVSLRQWGEQHLFAAEEAHSLLVDKRSQQRLAYMQPLSLDGDVVRLSDTEVMDKA
ncbi:MAG: helix-turn-helix transcriptional regulator [Neisseriaceae bacterium]|nr:helix-turn-helix transcriptional regulator [Neisseriaceae bacterium]MBP6863259.1 helix-turn-helix transcriptional regulator [Neisseriaceae bacterium]